MYDTDAKNGYLTYLVKEIQHLKLTDHKRNAQDHRLQPSFNFFSTRFRIISQRLEPNQYPLRQIVRLCKHVFNFGEINEQTIKLFLTGSS